VALFAAHDRRKSSIASAWVKSGICWASARGVRTAAPEASSHKPATNWHFQTSRTTKPTEQHQDLFRGSSVGSVRHGNAKAAALLAAPCVPQCALWGTNFCGERTSAGPDTDRSNFSQKTREMGHPHQTEVRFENGGTGPPPMPLMPTMQGGRHRSGYHAARASRRSSQ